jgi:16S rRNA (uracil1498-N3)-methyltransferase
MNPLLRNSDAHVFVQRLESPQLVPEDEHHLDRVLRLDQNDPITVSDGNGRWATARWSRRRGLELTSQIFSERQRPTLTIGCAIPKGERPELLVQKLTELGIDRISLFETARSVVHWDDERRSKRAERLTRVALEAAMQSRRTFLPRVEFTTFDRMIQRIGMTLAEPGGRDPIDEAVRGILIGPEGGFDSEELDVALPKISLSRHILRVETAAIVAAAMLVSHHG